MYTTVSLRTNVLLNQSQNIQIENHNEKFTNSFEMGTIVSLLFFGGGDGGCFLKIGVLLYFILFHSFISRIME